MNTGSNKFISLLVALIFFFSTGFPVLSYAAGKLKIIEGVIENVREDSITIGDKRYQITGVRILKPSGETVSMNELKRGKRVDLYFEDNRMSSVLIYEDMVQ